MSRTVHQTTGTFSSACGGDSYQQPQAPPQQASHNQQQRTTAQPSYSFGDVVFVLRRLGGTLQPLYHHAGIVTGVMDGTITQILHFDPLFDRHGDGDMPPWDLVKRSMVGVYSFPEFLDGHQLRTVFPEQDLHIEKCGPTDAHEIRAVQVRIEGVRQEIQKQLKRLYQLHAYNCQHFAMEMRTGIAHSPDADSALTSVLNTGLGAGMDAWNYHQGGSDVMSTVKGVFGFLVEAGAASAQEYMTQVQNRKTNAVCRQ